MPQLFRILDLQTGPKENEAMNRYHYDNPAATVMTAVEVATAFLGQVVDFLRLVQSSEWTHTALFVEDLLEPSNSVLATISGGGGNVAADASVAFSAWSYAFKPVGPTLKRGGKRIPGIAETWTDDDVVAAGGPEAAIEALAALFGAPIITGSGELNPAVVRPVPVVDPNSYIVSVILGSVYRQIGSQVSRKLSQGGGTSFSSLVPYFKASMSGASLAGVAPGDEGPEILSFLETVPAKNLYEVTRNV